MHIPLAQPDITEAEIEAVVEVLKTSHLALGPKLKEFEGAIGEGDEVITTPFSFISSSNCILFARGTGLRRHRSGDTVHRFRRN